MQPLVAKNSFCLELQSQVSGRVDATGKKEDGRISGLVQKQSFSDLSGNSATQQTAPLKPSVDLKEKKVKKSTKPSWKKIALATGGLLLGLGATALGRAVYFRSHYAGYSACGPYFNGMEVTELDSLCKTKGAGLAFESTIVEALKADAGSVWRLNYRISPELSNDKEFISRLMASRLAIGMIGSELLDDKDFMSDLVFSNVNAIKDYEGSIHDILYYFSPDLRNDKEFMSRLIGIRFDAISLIGSKLQNNSKEFLSILEGVALQQPTITSNPDFKYNLRLIPLNDKDLCLRAIPIYPKESLFLMHHNLSPDLKKDVDIALELIKHANTENLKDIYFVVSILSNHDDSIIFNHADNDAIARALCSKEPALFMDQYYWRFTERVRVATMKNWCLSQLEDVVESTRTEIQDMRDEQADEGTWKAYVEKQWKPLVDILAKLIDKDYLINSQDTKFHEIFLETIRKYPADLTDLNELFFIHNKNLALAMLDAFEESPFHQTFKDRKQILQKLVSRWDNDEEIAERLYQLDSSLFGSFSWSLRNNEQFLVQIGQIAKKKVRQLTPELTPDCRVLSDSEVKKYLNMDLITRLNDPVLKPTCTHGESPQAQLMLFPKFAETDEDAQALLSEFNPFTHEVCEKVTGTWKKMSLLVHPDKHPQDQERATLAFRRLENACDALEMSCPPPSQIRQNTNENDKNTGKTTAEKIHFVWEWIQKRFES